MPFRGKIDGHRVLQKSRVHFRIFLQVYGVLVVDRQFGFVLFAAPVLALSDRSGELHTRKSVLAVQIQVSYSSSPGDGCGMNCKRCVLFSSIPNCDLKQSPFFEMSYLVTAIGAPVGSITFFAVQVFFIGACLHITACLKDLRITYQQIDK